MQILEINLRWEDNLHNFYRSISSPKAYNIEILEMDE